MRKIKSYLKLQQGHTQNADDDEGIALAYRAEEGKKIETQDDRSTPAKRFPLLEPSIRLLGNFPQQEMFSYKQEQQFLQTIFKLKI